MGPMKQQQQQTTIQILHNVRDNILTVSNKRCSRERKLVALASLAYLAAKGYNTHYAPINIDSNCFLRGQPEAEAEAERRGELVSTLLLCIHNLLLLFS